jgi:hypothetical protein
MRIFCFRFYMPWFIKFESFLLTNRQTKEPLPFETMSECQEYVCTHCSPPEFNGPFQFIQAPNTEELQKFLGIMGNYRNN